MSSHHLPHRSTSGSALIGSPPATENDFWIVKGMLRAVHLDGKLDAEKGYSLLPKRPDDYQYEEKRAAIIAGMSVCIFVMVSVTVARLAIMAIAYPAIQIAMVVHGGGGKHSWDVTYAEYNDFNWLGVVCKILFFTSVGIIKISITLFNRRLTSMTSRIWRYFNDFFLFLLTAYTLLALFWTCFQCNPPAAMWDKVYSGKLATMPTCWSTKVISNVLSIMHVVMDFCLLTTPIIVLWKVKLPTGTKIRLYVVFSMGAVSAIGSVLRQLAQEKISLDVTWGYTGILTWTLVDLTFGLLTASLPVLVGLLPSSWRSMSGNRSRSHSRPYGGGSAIDGAGCRGYQLSGTTAAGTTMQSRTATGGSGSTGSKGGGRASDEGGILVEEEFELTFHNVKPNKVFDEEGGSGVVEGRGKR
ncbi:putative integral membrane protein [Diplodia seriata]|uniref:Putative integral membrane protein n=1 Tax=Diplodia seriata TaxID=420778 RepID=A0A0G2FN00_9PEZI|nr:putative integral membrane protein [Diplodia seriata]